jgi:hypothetical protein
MDHHKGSTYTAKQNRKTRAYLSATSRILTHAPTVLTAQIRMILTIQIRDFDLSEFRVNAVSYEFIKFYFIYGRLKNELNRLSKTKS